MSRLTAALAAERLPLADARRARGRVVVVVGAPSAWAGVLPAFSLRSRGWLAIPDSGAARPAPPGFLRVILPSQAAAREWSAVVAPGRLVVVEPGPPASPAPGGVFVAGEPDRVDPEALIAAARAGAAIVSTVAHDVLPPGALVRADGETAAAELRADPARRQALGALARAWAERGRRPDDEAAAWRTIVAEAVAMSRRGGRGAGL